jgi:hypothetical protein
MAKKWVWLPASPTGGTGGGAYSKLFRNDALPTADLLAREVIQNSWDAALRHEIRDAPPFKFRFRFVTLSGAAKKRFLEAADLGALQARRRLLGESNDLPSRVAVDELVNTKSPLTLLYLEDYGTHGMFGDPAKVTGSHLYKALYVLGSTSKDGQEAAKGGSFGFGKSAFIGTSEIRTAIAHTRFAARSNDRATQRLIGFTWWGEHEADKRPFEGRAMFGEAAKESRLGATPLTDKNAQSVADLLGMPERDGSEGSLGSTVLLISPNVSASEIVDAVERYWWPALVDHLIEVIIETSDGTEIVPNPQQNPKLRPFLQAYGIVTGTKTPKNAKEEILASSSWRSDGTGTKFGKLALVIDRENSTSFAEEEDISVGNMTTPTVALIRGPRMVIEYKSYSSRLPIRGVYLADASIDGALRAVEPPSHNTWDNTSSRDVPEAAKAIAGGVLRRIKRSVKEFANEFAPPPATVVTDLPLFGDLLSPFLTGRVAGPTPPPQPGEAKPNLSFQPFGAEKRLTQANGDLVLQRSIAIKIPDFEEWELAKLTVSFQAAIAQELSGRSSDHLELSVSAPDEFSRDLSVVISPSGSLQLDGRSGGGRSE